MRTVLTRIQNWPTHTTSRIWGVERTPRQFSYTRASALIQSANYHCKELGLMHVRWSYDNNILIDMLLSPSPPHLWWLFDGVLNLFSSLTVDWATSGAHGGADGFNQLQLAWLKEWLVHEINPLQEWSSHMTYVVSLCISPTIWVGEVNNTHTHKRGNHNCRNYNFLNYNYTISKS